MRFASIAIAITLSSKCSGFAPKAVTPAIRCGAGGPAFYKTAAVRGTSTSLNLFGFGKSSNVSAPAKVNGDITETEVRALFELWNSALATGDSRIVASLYTKVKYVLSRWALTI